MHEIAESSTSALRFVVLSAPRLSEVSHRTILNEECFPRVESSIQFHQSVLCMFLIVEFHVDITDHMLAKIFADLYVFNLAKFFQFFVDFFVEFIKLYVGGQVEIYHYRINKYKFEQILPLLEQQQLVVHLGHHQQQLQQRMDYSTYEER